MSHLFSFLPFHLYRVLAIFSHFPLFTFSLFPLSPFPFYTLSPFPSFTFYKHHNMRITVIAKNAGRRKELGKRPIELAKSPQTLQQLLEELTLMGLADAQAERTNLPLSQSDIDAQAEEGRVRFAEGYATNNDTPEKSLERMRQAFDDGLFRVFADGEELTQWQAPLALHEDSELVFIRFTMLTGLCWRMIF